MDKVSEKKLFEQNLVLLWGLKKANPKLLEEYDVGNKNPRSIKVLEALEAKKQKSKKGNKSNVKLVNKKVRVFNKNEDYTIDDIEFLEGENERLEDEMSKLTDFSKMDELIDLQNDIYEIVQKLKENKAKQEYQEAQKIAEETVVNIKDRDEKYKEIDKIKKELEELGKLYIQSRGDAKIRAKMDELESNIDKLHKKGEGIIKLIKPKKHENHYNDIDIFTKYNNKLIDKIGRGFKKGSEEAKKHAEKMRLAKEAKIKPKVIEKKETKARVIKGSEEAKELGRKLAEAKKKKKESNKTDNKFIELQLKGKPWFYLGTIPKGYREATMNEAIEAKKVSLYGKYTVDEKKWIMYDRYGLFLSEQKPVNIIVPIIHGLQRRIINTLKEIEILKTKIENPKYAKNKEDYKDDLEFEKDKAKYLQLGYEWYYKLLCAKTGKEYIKPKKITLPKQKEIIETDKSEEKELKEAERPLDPRTGKPIKYYFEEGYNDEEDEYIQVKRGNDNILLDVKYFNDSKTKLLSIYALKLSKKGIYLSSNWYNDDDYKKLFFH